MPISKNTYVVKITNVPQHYEYCKHTPFSVITINGIEQQKPSGFMTMTDFPNPSAAFMAKNFDNAAKIYGTELAQTIVEYLDKNKNPVLMLFPNNDIMKKDKNLSIKQLLTADNFKDLKNEIEIRNNLFEKHKTK